MSEFDPGKIIIVKVLTQEGEKLEVELSRNFSEGSSLIVCEFREPDYSLQVLLTGMRPLVGKKESLTFFFPSSPVTSNMIISSASISAEYVLGFTQSELIGVSIELLLPRLRLEDGDQFIICKRKNSEIIFVTTSTRKKAESEDFVVILSRRRGGKEVSFVFVWFCVFVF